MRPFVLFTMLFLLLPTLSFGDVKLRQRVTFSGQSMETTTMIKGRRQRVESKRGAGDEQAASYMPELATITQCDMRRTVSINDRDKLYFIQPFMTETPEAAPPVKNVPADQPAGQARQGGTITMTFIATDTGERKTIFGLVARHIKIMQQTEASADSCNGPNMQKMEIDGWYVDFQMEFNCETSAGRFGGVQGRIRPDCVDKIVSKHSGTTNPGFLLNGTLTMYGADGRVLMTQTTETLEISRDPLSAALFDVPAGYQQAASQQDLYRMPSVDQMINQQRQQQQQNNNRVDRTEGQNTVVVPKAALRSVSLNVNFGSAVRVNQQQIIQYLRGRLLRNDLNATQGGTADYVMKVEVRQAKESTAGKIGSIFGKVTGVNTGTQKVDVELVMTVLSPDSSKQIAQARIAQKFDGTDEEAVQAAVDAALDQVIARMK